MESVKAWLKDEVLGDYARLALTVVAAVVTAALTAVGAALEGVPKTGIAVYALLALVGMLALVALVLHLATKAWFSTKVAGTLGSVALFGVLWFTTQWFTGLLNEVSDLRIKASTAPERIVERESPNPDLQVRISQLEGERATDKATINQLTEKVTVVETASKEKVAAYEKSFKERDTIIDDLRAQINGRDERRQLSSALSKASTAIGRLRAKCKEVEPKAFAAEANKELNAAIRLLQKFGRDSDARQIAQGNAPLGMPRPIGHDCSPYAENNQIALRILVREYILTEIAGRVSR